MSKPDIEKKTENIFDLTKLAPVEAQQQIHKASKYISHEEQSKLLSNYAELDKDKWGSLKYGDHIRYLRCDGTFRRGGFYKSTGVGKGARSGKPHIQLSPSYNTSVNIWTVYLCDIEKIWIKAVDKNILSNTGIGAGEYANIKGTVSDQCEKIEYLTAGINQMKIDMLKLNNENKRIINLIKKLHGIRSSSSK